ncbi:calcitonin gene-related peptide type 1 receptor-like, partial [Uranotaenia lowii]|uniref:calcitonin gene-related peptide type 1 receptor-like n=1 Tax=Uranotaenia lowii TaxID=190385 RepID=UPI00247A1E9D
PLSHKDSSKDTQGRLSSSMCGVSCEGPSMRAAARLGSPLLGLLPPSEVTVVKNANPRQGKWHMLSSTGFFAAAGAIAKNYKPLVPKIARSSINCRLQLLPPILTSGSLLSVEFPPRSAAAPGPAFHPGVFRRLVNDLYIGGYTISLITLIVSLCVFFSFRTLKCTRIRIHINLFISLALSCICWLCWYKLVIEDPDVTNRNEDWCIGLHILLHYLMLVNYFWMFCEGLHLHLVLVIVFIKDAIAMRWFVTIGWIFPVLFVATYAAIRSNYTTDVE